MASKKNLSTKMRHSIFIREYVRHGNGMKAAITAGYSSARAKVSASELLSRPEIRQAIESKIRAREKRLDISADRVATELFILGTSRITDLGEIIDGEFQPWDSAELDDIDIAAIAEISQITRESPDGTKNTKLRLKTYNRLEALKELNRMFGTTTDMNTLISGLRAYGLNIVKDAQERWHLIDERLPPSERPPLNVENFIEAEAEPIPVEEEE
jgi:phage terminase small subunit